MKLINKITISSLLLSLLVMTGCDLDKFPEGSTILDEQKKDVIAKNSDRLAADVNGLSAGLTTYNVLNLSSAQHYDYGVPAFSMMVEASGQDVIGPDAGYNWYRNCMRYTDRIHTSDLNKFIWFTFYNLIKTANDILAVVDQANLDSETKKFLGQAYASRAYAYLNLVQTFQFTYAGNEDKPAVPIVTESMTTEELANNPRASVRQVYDLIINDLNKAIELLGEFKGSSVPKNMINLQTAYGLRARASLIMQNWQQAASDAEKAQEGYTPYSREAVSKPTFNNASASAWMWAILITPENAVVKTGILNWPSHLCSFTGNGYTTLVAQYRTINNKLWAQIPETDVRKGWWVDENLSAPWTDQQTMTYRGVEYSLADYYEWLPYTNVKFHAYQDILDNSQNASDWCLMRVEEMILIQAEALAMSGNIAGGKSVLESFIQTYRDAEYTCTATSPQAFQDEVWFQRRVELWGEGFSLFDLHRLNKPVLRKGTNYPVIYQYDMEPNHKILLYRIPEVEINVNDGISEADNNEAVPPPTV